MRALTAMLLIVLALPAAAPAAAPRTTLPDVEDEVMCVTCGTALNISQAPSADRERAFIRRRISEGLSKDRIKQRLVAEYGPEVLAEPHQRSAWLIPVVLALLALAAVAATVARWRRAARSTPEAQRSAPLDDAANRRLEADMRGYEA